MKDYYDHVVQTMGIDELVVYDRRDCFPIDPQKSYIENSNIAHWFKNGIVYDDKKRSSIKRWSSSKVFDIKDTNSHKDKHADILEGKVYHFVLEIGYHHYYFEVERYIDDNDNLKAVVNYWLIGKKDIPKNEKISEAPMCICPCTLAKSFWNSSSKYDVRFTKHQLEMKIDNPILFRTYIPKFIDAMEVWNNLYEYISSLRDKEFVDTRSNEQHIESNGFDKKISFRHRKK